MITLLLPAYDEERGLENLLRRVRALAYETLPSAPDASVVSVKTKTPVKRVTNSRKGKRKKYYLIMAPRKCKREWKGSGTFYFATGETQKVSIAQKCKKQKRRRP